MIFNGWVAGLAAIFSGKAVDRVDRPWSIRPGGMFSPIVRNAFSVALVMGS